MACHYHFPTPGTTTATPGRRARCRMNCSRGGEPIDNCQQWLDSNSLRWRGKTPNAENELPRIERELMALDESSGGRSCSVGGGAGSGGRPRAVRPQGRNRVLLHALRNRRQGRRPGATVSPRRPGGAGQREAPGRGGVTFAVTDLEKTTPVSYTGQCRISSAKGRAW